MFRTADALVSYMLSLPGNEELSTVNPVVAETNDGVLSDVRRRPVTEEHVFAALRGATYGPVAEGAVGAGTGTTALGYKSGIGTSSRIADCGTGPPVTVGTLVQANFGGTLTVLGVPVPAEPAVGGEATGSCVIVLATDAPLDSRQLTRVAWRSIFAMGRTGSRLSGRSVDYALAFSAAPPAPGLLPDGALEPLFTAAMDATEEAILNSLLAAQTTTGFGGHVMHAVSLDRVRQLCRAQEFWPLAISGADEQCSPSVQNPCQ